jgi:pre-mRNA-splicing factor ISY1
VNKRRCRYVIYKKMDVSSYYGYMNDEDGILEKVEQPAEEEMRGRELMK